MSRSLDADSWGSLAASFADSAVVIGSREVAEPQLSQEPVPCHLQAIAHPSLDLNAARY